MTNRVVIHWKEMVGGSTDVRIDFGQRDIPGRNFGVGFEMSLSCPVADASADYLATWQKKASEIIRGNVMLLMTHPVGTLLSTYTLRIDEHPPSRYVGYVVTSIESDMLSRVGDELYAGYKQLAACIPAVRRTG